MMRLLLYLSLVVLLTLVGYANLRFVNPSAQLEPIDVQTFEVAGMGHEVAGQMRNRLMEDPSVRAVSINENKGLVGVTFHYRKLDKERLLSLIGMDGRLEVKPHVFERMAKGGCPVRGMVVAWEKTLDFVRFVD